MQDQGLRAICAPASREGFFSRIKRRALISFARRPIHRKHVADIAPARDAKHVRRCLFNITSLLSLMLFVATSVLWARSYWIGDQLHLWSADTTANVLTSCDGVSGSGHLVFFSFRMKVEGPNAAAWVIICREGVRSIPKWQHLQPDKLSAPQG